MVFVSWSFLQRRVFRPQSSGRSAWGWGGGGLLRCAPYGSCNHTDTGSQIECPRSPRPRAGRSAHLFFDLSQGLDGDPHQVHLVQLHTDNKQA